MHLHHYPSAPPTTIKMGHCTLLMWRCASCRALVRRRRHRRRLSKHTKRQAVHAQGVRRPCTRNTLAIDPTQSFAHSFAIIFMKTMKMTATHAPKHALSSQDSSINETPNAPQWALPSAVAFALRHAGIDTLFPVQQVLLNAVPSTTHHATRTPPNDLCIAAATGSGKTLAYLLPIVRALAGTSPIRDVDDGIDNDIDTNIDTNIDNETKDISNSSHDKITKTHPLEPRNRSDHRSQQHRIRREHRLRALIVVPTRDLALQVKTVLDTLLTPPQDTARQNVTSTIIRDAAELRRAVHAVVVTGTGSFADEQRLLVRSLHPPRTTGNDSVTSTSTNTIINEIFDIDVISSNNTTDIRDSSCDNSFADAMWTSLTALRQHIPPSAALNNNNNNNNSSNFNGIGEYQDGADIVICTPGRLADHIRYTPGFNLRRLQFLVLDEADRLVSQNYQDILALILGAIDNANPTTTASTSTIPLFGTGSSVEDPLIASPRRFVQKLLFSATLTSDPRLITLLKLHEPMYVRMQNSTQGSRISNVTIGPLRDAVIADLNEEPIEKDEKPNNINEHFDGSRNDKKPGEIDDNNVDNEESVSKSHKRTLQSDDVGSNDGDSGENVGSNAENIDSDDNRGVERTRNLRTAKYSLPSTLREYVSVCVEPEIVSKPLQLLLLLLKYELKGVLIFTKSVAATHRLSALLQVFQSNWKAKYLDNKKLSSTKGETNVDLDLHESELQVFLDEYEEISKFDLKRAARLCATYLNSLNVRSFSAELKQGERTKLLNDFKDGNVNVLVVSDVVCRGVDLGNMVRVVINYDVPTRLQAYVHRVGRTARASNDGVAISILEPREMKWFKSEIVRNSDVSHTYLSSKTNENECNLTKGHNTQITFPKLKILGATTGSARSIDPRKKRKLLKENMDSSVTATQTDDTVIEEIEPVLQNPLVKELQAIYEASLSQVGAMVHADK